MNIDKRFQFCTVDESVMNDVIDLLDINKPTTHNNIPTRVLVENRDIISPFVTEIYNESTQMPTF